MINAKNGIGWEVQEHQTGNGWVSISEAFKTRHEAIDYLLKSGVISSEKRIYEVLS